MTFFCGEHSNDLAFFYLMKKQNMPMFEVFFLISIAVSNKACKKCVKWVWNIFVHHSQAKFCCSFYNNKVKKILNKNARIQTKEVKTLMRWNKNSWKHTHTLYISLFSAARPFIWATIHPYRTCFMILMLVMLILMIHESALLNCSLSRTKNICRFFKIWTFFTNKTYFAKVKMKLI